VSEWEREREKERERERERKNAMWKKSADTETSLFHGGVGVEIYNVLR